MFVEKIKTIRLIRLASIIVISLTLISCNATLHNYQYHEIPGSESDLPLLYAARTNEIIASNPSKLSKNISTATQLALRVAFAVASNGTTMLGTTSSHSPFPGEGKHFDKNYELHADIEGKLVPLRDFITQGHPTAFQPETFLDASGVIAFNFYANNSRGGYSENIGSIPSHDLFLGGHVPVLAIGYQEGDFGFGLRLIHLPQKEHDFCRGLSKSGLSKTEIAHEIRSKSLLAVDSKSGKEYAQAYHFACNTVLWAEPAENVQHASAFLTRLNRRGERVRKVLKLVRDSNWGSPSDSWVESLEKDDRRNYLNASSAESIILDLHDPKSS